MAGGKDVERGDGARELKVGVIHPTDVVNEGIEPACDNGVPRMDAKTLERCAVKANGYVSPELNEVLMLQYKGFRRIEGLDAYTNLNSLFLESNGISRIENMAPLSNLVSLYLQSNCIARIENLEALTSLRVLNLANNSITQVENLAPLTQLDTLNVSGNKIDCVEGLAGLAERPTLKSVNVAYNYVEDGDALLAFWPRALPEVECLYLQHNTCSRTLKDLRRRVISSLPKLRWLDERPVSELERVGFEAWAQGGKDAEFAAQQALVLKQKADKERSFYASRRLREATAQRARAQAEAQAKRDAARARVSSEFANTGTLAEGWVKVPQRLAAPADPAAPAECSPGAPKGRGEETVAGPRQDPAEKPAGREKLLQSVRQVLASAVCEDPVAPEAEPTECHGEAAAAAAPVADAAELAVEGAAEEATQPFEWTSFRERRLGRIVAEFRYDFSRAAAALGQEFGLSLTEQDCRKKYGELMRPSKSATGATGQDIFEEHRARDRLAAKDVASADLAAVQEVSNWWVRKLEREGKEVLAGRKKAPEARPRVEESDVNVPSQAGIDMQVSSPVQLDTSVFDDGLAALEGGAVSGAAILSTDLAGDAAAPFAPRPRTVAAAAPAATAAQDNFFELD